MCCNHDRRLRDGPWRCGTGLVARPRGRRRQILDCAPDARRTAVLRFVNLATGVTPGSCFQISTKRDPGQTRVSAANSRSVAKAAPLLADRARFPETATSIRLSVRIVNCFNLHLSRSCPCMAHVFWGVKQNSPTVLRALVLSAARLSGEPAPVGRRFPTRQALRVRSFVVALRALAYAHWSAGGRVGLQLPRSTSCFLP